MDKFYSKSIEDLAKNAFEKEAGDAISSSANWDKMQQLLDVEMPQKRKKRPVVFWFFVFLMAGLLIAGATKYFTGKQSTETVKPVVNKNDHTGIKSPIIVNKESNDSKATAEQKSRSISTFMPESKSALKPASKSTIKSELSENPLQNSVPNKQLQAIVPDQYFQKKLDTVEATKQEFVNMQIDSAGSKSETKNPLLEDTTIAQINNKIAEKKLSKWEWNLTVAPDFLLANMQPLHQPGFTLGVGINYLLFPKWRIRSGLLYNYTPVNASGDGYLYKPSPNLPSYTSLELRNVKGSLHVFEVPLSLRYTDRPNKKWSFISSVGLSSLFFIKQQYTYDLLLNGSTPLLWNSANDTDDDGESHILNNLTIGAGLSVKTKRNLVLEIEPMFKLPLEELGEGHNKLGTIALYINLRMPIVKQKK
ncbi:outer membrane beta-barrel protein [Sediminibacterium sp.]|uniref:outer membrane beta-barrel protein n=1 Tax=Sediminibacterium sp. TaxID=1917865 RepID=UPI002733893C|nr:outer membrane beta-barrel protein [Sediminibacterium sp.]MDP3394471.1 outer membrane beta-barrel protein [Sediminibacterium sp.]MDP3568306.1 outer membrane beta-barrel protein [Sediminibacterium sp.]